MKKIVNRFWEFLMLFIAISLGFFVENYREVLVDRQKEKEIIASFINDLETDIKELDIVIQRRETREVRIDSIIYILNNGLQDDYGKIFTIMRDTYHALLCFGQTIQQMKS